MLLKRNDLNADQPDATYGRTPLAWAVAAGRERAVAMLLERRDINPNLTFTQDFQTPLS